MPPITTTAPKMAAINLGSRSADFAAGAGASSSGAVTFLAALALVALAFAAVPLAGTLLAVVPVFAAPGLGDTPFFVAGVVGLEAVVLPDALEPGFLEEGPAVAIINPDNYQGAFPSPSIIIFALQTY
jgi:hypothetical protein